MARSRADQITCKTLIFPACSRRGLGEGYCRLDLLWPNHNVVNVNAKEVTSMNLSDPVDTAAMSIPCSLTLLPDELLVARAKDGDTSAFVELRERHSTKVLRTVFRITRNWEDAEDALQEALLRAFRHLNGFENRCSFSSWLTRIAINSALMTLRKRRACKELSIDITGDDGEIFGRLEPQDLRKTLNPVTHGAREKNCLAGQSSNSNQAFAT
jgi:RNA polymerase sigma factor (sigma-70 family)